MKTIVRAGIAALAIASVGALAMVRAAEDDAKPRELVVFAAASLKEAFAKLAEDFEAAHAGTHVALQLAGSQELRAQIEHGAAPDVFASADLEHMSGLQRAGLVGDSTVFARNEPVVVIPAENPAGVGRFEDLPKAKKLVVGTAEVPIGRYTARIFEKAGNDLGDEFAKAIAANVVSRELNVRQILAKVSLGEADAAVVYRTDAAAAGENVKVIEIPAKWNVVAEYPIAATTKAPVPELAKRFVELVLSPGGQKVLADAGFEPAKAR